MRLLPALVAIAALSAVALPAAADTAGDYQIYTLGNLNLTGNQITARAAVGGNATFTNTTIGGATPANPGSLVVGGNLTYNQGGTINGGALVKGTSTTPAYMASSVTSGLNSLPVDFSIENLRLKNLSTTLAGKTATGTASVQYGGLNLTGLNSDLNVFTISASDLSSINWASANIASGSQVLINVTGTTVNLTGGLGFYNGSNILWNFSQATTINASNLSLNGTILAPLANFQAGGGTLNGDLIAGSFNGAMSFGNASYAGKLLDAAKSSPSLGATMPVPEPGTWALMILGFGFVGAVLRRRRGLDAAAALQA